MERQTQPATQNPTTAAPSTGGGPAALVSPAAVPVGGRWRLRHPRIGALCSPVSLPPDTGPPLLSHRQSLAPSANARLPTQTRTPPHKRPQETRTPPGGGRCQAPAPAGALVWWHDPARGSGQPAGALVQDGPWLWAGPLGLRT